MLYKKQHQVCKAKVKVTYMWLLLHVDWHLQNHRSATAEQEVVKVQ